MKRIGVLGGTFDPPHKGHIYIAKEAYKRLELDKIIFMPAGTPPHKTYKQITDGHIRYEMVKLTVKTYPYFVVSNYEISKNGLSYTYLTLRHLKKENKDSEIYFIAGADSLLQLEEWRNVQEILDDATLVIFGRPGFSKEKLLRKKYIIEEKYKHEIIYLDLLELDISSSDIRKEINKGLPIPSLINEEVRKYINDMGLYKER